MRLRAIYPTHGAFVIGMLVCVAAPIALIGLQTGADRRFSPVDEPAHLDYVDRIARGDLPREGQTLLRTTLRQIACRRIEFGTERVPPCSTRRLSPRQFDLPLQYEAQQPPVYYAVTVATRWVTHRVIGVRDTLRAARLGNVAWLIGGLLLLWVAGRAIRVRPLAAALLLLATAPNVIYFTGIVSDDATAVFAGGLVAAGAALTYGRAPPWKPAALFAIGALVAGMKTTNLFAVVAVAGVLAVAEARRTDRAKSWTSSTWRWARGGGALLLGAAVVVVGWALLYRARAVIPPAKDPSFALLRPGPRTLGHVMSQATELLQPLAPLAPLPLSPQTLWQDAQAPFDALLTFLVLAAALSGLFTAPRRWFHALGLVSVVVLYVVGILFGIALMRTYDISPSLPGRYALSLGAILMPVLAAATKGRVAERALAVFATASFITTLTVMLS